MTDPKPPADPPPVPPTSPPAAPPLTPPRSPTGAYKVWPADANGNPIATDQPANPSDSKAVEIYFGILDSSTPVPKEQSELQAAIDQVLATIKTLYIADDGAPAPPFRLYYTRLFRLAELGLEGKAMPDIANSALERVVDDLIDAEAGRVKNAHLAVLGSRALALASAFLVLYLAMCLLPKSPLDGLGIDRATAKSFMVLWIGCFGGVWLSYAIRTTTFKLRDLVVADADRLLPLTRLIFAGLLTMTLGLMLALDFINIAIGGESLAAFTREPTKALLLGIFCGVSELLLPTMIGKRAADLLAKIQ